MSHRPGDARTRCPLTLINVTPRFSNAAHLEPVTLRSLDAIHLAAALEPVTT
ncbi:MAG: hypothetical protein LC118_18390 [Dehalococcoidia bacterium]|nr:hypothetical protein [Dehalococcoidia bacterium]